jgi:dihydrolipoamide dehydrogenase
MSPNRLHDFDLVVIGGGPGGYTAAIKASQAGLSTALVESDRLGGICLNWGCIPTKSLLRSADIYEQTRRAGEFGVAVDNIGFDWRGIIERSRRISNRFSDGISLLMGKNNITVFFGKALLVGGKKIVVEGDNGITISANYIIFATGAHPRNLLGIAIDRASILSYREAMTLEERPESIVIIGAGAVGVEFACFFNTFGTQVTLIEVLDNILPGLDEEVTKRLKSLLRNAGITVMTSTAVTGVAVSGNQCSVSTVSSGMIEAEKVLLAAGVSGNIDGIGLGEAGVVCKNGFIQVDSSCRTSVDGIWAVGDCIGLPLLAHAASYEAECAVEAILGRDMRRSDVLFPFCVYSKPNAAGIGLTERAAHEAGYDTAIGRCPFRINGIAAALGEPEGFVKVVIDRKSGKILGAHILGVSAPEVLQEIVLAMQAEIPADILLKTVHPHPSLSEAVQEAVAGALGRPINF